MSRIFWQRTNLCAVFISLSLFFYLVYSFYMYISLQDLLLIVSSISLALVAGFLCWTLYEVARLLRNVNVIANIIRENIERVETMIEMVGEKLHGLSSYSGVMARAGERILDYVMGQVVDRADLPSSKAKKKTKRTMPSLVDLDEE